MKKGVMKALQKALQNSLQNIIHYKMGNPKDVMNTNQPLQNYKIYNFCNAFCKGLKSCISYTYLILLQNYIFL
jgi:uncharacterized protein (DUF2235 family)